MSTFYCTGTKDGEGCALGASSWTEFADGLSPLPVPYQCDHCWHKDNAPDKPCDCADCSDNAAIADENV